MSNALAIAAATSTIRNLFVNEIPKRDTDLGDLEVTTQPLDLARKNVTKAQLNLFLYQTVINAGWRNLDVPTDVRQGERGVPPLPLNLRYLITAYGRNDTDNDAVSHRVLGGAMSVLHDHPLLGRAEIQTSLAGNDLGNQFERLRITPVTMTLEEMSKLWTTFQTQYRISAAYEVTVVLIDSRRAATAALPVLRQGDPNRGPVAFAGTAPTLTEIRPPRSQSAARLGEDIVLVGTQLTTADTVVRFTHSRIAQPIELTPQPGTRPEELAVHIPNDIEDTAAFSRWVPGLYSAGLVVRRSGTPAIVSNEVPFVLAPRITVAPATAAAGAFTLTITCAPRLAAGQRVMLLFGDRLAAPATLTTPADTSQPTTLTFDLEDVVAGSHIVRLRVDGVDSLPVIAAGTPPQPSFDPAQTVTVS